MKTMNAKAMTKGAIAEALSTSTEIKKSECKQIMNNLACREREEAERKTKEEADCQCRYGKKLERRDAARRFVGQLWSHRVHLIALCAPH